jgi:pimeloyl-ACP methyl ester carboxylesterase
MAQLFVPGFGARASFYREALGPDWLLHDPPPFRTRSGFAAHVDALRRRIVACEQPVVLAGHSLGAACAVAATAHAPELVSSLLLIAPAGLPLAKPMSESLRDFGGQVRDGVYPRGDLGRAVRDLLRAPVSAFRLARAVHELDLQHELASVRAAGVPCDVVGVAGDTLTTLDHCRRIADLAGARFREVAASGGHMWMVVDPAAFAALRA